MACDLGKTTSQASAKQVAVATIFSTPEVEVKAAAVAIPDASVPRFDAGGFSFDAGAPSMYADAGYTLLPQNIAYLFFGERQGDTLDAAPVAVTGASVTLADSSGGTWPLSETGGGAYQLAGEDAGFAYREGTTYTFSIAKGGVTWAAEVKNAPAKENIAQFHPPAGFIEQAAGAPFAFTRPEPASGQELNVGYVSVFPLTHDAKLNPTYTNVPRAPLEFLKLILAPQEFKKTSVTIPGSAFPSANTNYLVVLQSVKTGGAKSDNLFLGSAIFAGAADIAIVKTR